MLSRENIKLRPIEKNDLKLLNIWKNDYEIFKFLGGGYSPESIDQQNLYIDNMINMSKDKRFIIENLGVSIGLIGIYGINYRDRNCEIGIYIGNKEYWGKGIAKNSLEILINYIFNNLNLRKIKLLVVEKNVAAINIYKNIGFNTIGIFKEDRFINGKYENVIAMEFLKREK